MVDAASLRRKVEEDLQSITHAESDRSALYYSTQAICSALMAIHQELAELNFAFEHSRR